MLMRCCRFRHLFRWLSGGKDNYRIIKIEEAGRLSRHRSFVCDNDDDAIVWRDNQSMMHQSSFGAALASWLA